MYSLAFRHSEVVAQWRARARSLFWQLARQVAGRKNRVIVKGLASGFDSRLLHHRRQLVPGCRSNTRMIVSYTLERGPTEDVAQVERRRKTILVCYLARCKVGRMMRVTFQESAGPGLTPGVLHLRLGIGGADVRARCRRAGHS